MNSTSKVLVAFAAGAVAGAIAGLLLAPAKGADTRKKIAETGKKIADSVTDMCGACTRKVKEYANSQES